MCWRLTWKEVKRKWQWVRDMRKITSLSEYIRLKPIFERIEGFHSVTVMVRTCQSNLKSFKDSAHFHFFSLVWRDEEHCGFKRCHFKWLYQAFSLNESHTLPSGFWIGQILYREKLKTGHMVVCKWLPAFSWSLTVGVSQLVVPHVWFGRGLHRVSFLVHPQRGRASFTTSLGAC